MWFAFTPVNAGNGKPAPSILKFPAMDAELRKPYRTFRRHFKDFVFAPDDFLVQEGLRESNPQRAGEMIVAGPRLSQRLRFQSLME